MLLAIYFGCNGDHAFVQITLLRLEDNLGGFVIEPVQGYGAWWHFVIDVFLIVIAVEPGLLPNGVHDDQVTR
ncbi:hypothetical protein [Virgisporangium aurantiacum]|uniref:hypothetical protein n=1 Tax=Virgisporangium aurantiacum TaxID=175570 RepID=UPI0019507551|nr:hypothetical protein [Virgisporangium aurantiacum]